MANPGRFCQNLFRKKRGSYSPETPSHYNVEVSEEVRKARKEKKRQDWEKKKEGKRRKRRLVWTATMATYHDNEVSGNQSCRLSPHSG